MIELLEAIGDCFDDNENFVIATIIEKSGSSKRSPGAKMLIKNDFSSVGYIGGGLIEAMTIQAAAKVFRHKFFRVEKFSLSNKEPGNLGIICGGDLKILLEYVDCNDKMMMKFAKKIKLLNKRKMDFLMITKIPMKENASTEKWIYTETGLYGSESQEILSIINEIKTNFNEKKYLEPFFKNNRYFIEPSFNNENVCIMGAGHIGKVLAELCKMLGFYVVMVDDREDFTNDRQFKIADEMKFIPHYKGLNEHININKKSFVVIVTRGHSYDKEILAQMMETKAQYIGMIGSKKKRTYIYDCLLADGFTQQDLDRVHSPIGLPIHGQTPEEIAISIVAEIVQVRRVTKDDTNVSYNGRR
ncbi:XdhC family aldehyde oxidoreductase maturation factor [Acetobacterium bakii]|uniref:Molybdenum dehydrogenase n=1 Tax=Acetobacterium bakii TaxID=52689 RepID=A0A0L6TZE1_9FIRM|nr:XdhC/CoxI family protein [Acetobacterium bakii]KNZ41437.1 molybdenum dehydrogenase [Acetobacterium bakii]